MRGFALLEALVAAALVAGGLLSLAHLTASAVAVNAAARYDTIATTLAAQKIEELRTGAALALTESIEHVDSSGYVVGSGESAPLGAIYTRRWTIRPLPSAPARLVLIDLRVEPIANANGDRNRRRRAPVRLTTVTALSAP